MQSTPVPLRPPLAGRPEVGQARVVGDGMGASIAQRGGYIGRWLAVGCVGAALCGLPAMAADPDTVVGTYCLQGVREVGSCLRLSPEGK